MTKVEDIPSGPKRTPAAADPSAQGRAGRAQQTEADDGSLAGSSPDRGSRVRTSSNTDGTLFAAAAVLCAVGLAAAAELTHVHVQAHLNPQTESFCALSETVNCDTVARETAYSVFLRVPVSVWGIVGYLAMGLTAVWGWRARERAAPTGALAALVGVSTSVSLVLGSISAFVIRSVCILCLLTYTVNTALAVLCAILLRRQGLPASVRAARGWATRNGQTSLGLAAAGVGVVALLIGFYPRYWLAPAHATAAELNRKALQNLTADGIPTGVTEEQHHWIGARSPELTIEEFSDYQCPFCSHAHAALRALIRAHPDKLRLVHRHFPLDHHCNPVIPGPFHPRACYFAAVAACAGQQNKFWEANDYLFQHGHAEAPLELAAFAAATGVAQAKLESCVKEQADRLLKADLAEGNRLRIVGTPTFRINGKAYMGELPAEILAPYLAPASSASAPSAPVGSANPAEHGVRPNSVPPGPGSAP